MDRNKIAKIGAIVMILSLMLTIFIGAMSVKAATPAPGVTPPPMSASVPTVPAPAPAPSKPVTDVKLGPNGDVDGDGIPNNVDPDIDGDGIPNGLDPDIDGDGIPNALDPNPASTNLVDSTPPGQFAATQTWQWGGGIGVLLVLGWLVALPYIRRRRGTATKR